MCINNDKRLEVPEYRQVREAIEALKREVIKHLNADVRRTKEIAQLITNRKV